MNVLSPRVSPLVVPAFVGALLLATAIPAQTTTPEAEPNNTPATATALTSVTSCQIASGSVSPGTDLDYYSFTAPAGSRVWALVDTSPNVDPAVSDSLLRLFDTNGTTQLEFDDDDGAGTGCDGTLENQLSSAIAGRTLTAAGTYFLRVEGVKSFPVTSYRLTVVVSTSAQAEVEPNNTTATANSIATAGAPIGVRNGAINPIGDADFYSVVAPAGSTIFISADGDPERNGGTDIVVDLIQPNGTTVIYSADNSDVLGFPAPPAESFCFNVTTAGTYFVRVTGAPTKNVTGTYSLLVALCGLPATPTPTATATGTRTATPTQTATSIVGVATATPTRTPTLAAATPTQTPTLAAATVTATASSTPIGGVAPSNIPTLSFPMLLLMAVGLVTTAYLLIRRA